MVAHGVSAQAVGTDEINEEAPEGRHKPDQVCAAPPGLLESSLAYPRLTR